jgi:hypothetical protein
MTSLPYVLFDTLKLKVGSQSSFLSGKSSGRRYTKIRGFTTALLFLKTIDLFTKVLSFIS